MKKIALSVALVAAMILGTASLSAQKSSTKVVKTEQTTPKKESKKTCNKEVKKEINVKKSETVTATPKKSVSPTTTVKPVKANPKK